MLSKESVKCANNISVGVGPHARWSEPGFSVSLKRGSPTGPRMTRRKGSVNPFVMLSLFSPCNALVRDSEALATACGWKVEVV